MKFYVGLSLFVGLILTYVFVVRPKLEKNPATAALFAKLNAVEAVLWQKSRTILVARIYMLAPVVIAAHDWLSGAGIDWSPVTSKYLTWLPADYQGIVLGLLVSGTGVIIEALRRVTTVPLSEKVPPQG